MNINKYMFSIVVVGGSFCLGCFKGSSQGKKVGAPLHRAVTHEYMKVGRDHVLLNLSSHYHTCPSGSPTCLQRSLGRIFPLDYAVQECADYLVDTFKQCV